MPQPSTERAAASQPKRRYTSKACEECRRRRAKCDGHRPVCSRCSERSIKCQYRSEEDGRKPASKSYVQLLRNRIDLLEAVLQSHSIDIEASVAQLSAAGTTPPQLNPVPGTSASGSEPALAGLSPSEFDDLCATFEGALSLDESVNYDQDGEMRYFGPSSGRLEFQTESTPEADDQGSSPATTKSVDSNRYILPIEKEKYPEDLQNELIDLFFEYQNPWCQTVDERLFRQSMKTQGRYYSPLLLNCMMALGSRYTDRIDVRSVPEDQNTAGKPFLQKAEVLLHYDMKRPTITTIQSMSILVGVYVSYGCDAAGWLHQGMANRLALDMGLNLDAASLAGSNLIPTEEIELRRQIYWALYCDDKLAAIYTGRVCNFLDVQGAVNLPSVPENMTEETTEIGGMARCNQKILVHRALIGLCRILENILLALYAPKPLYKGPQRISFLHSCTLELKTWFYELPAELRIDRPNDLPQVYTLNMVYHTCCILLFKPFLLRPSKQPPATLKSDAVRRAEVLCVESAKRICLACKKYRQVFGGFRRSPISATHCILTASLVLIQYALPDPDMAGSGRPCCTPYIELCLEVLAELSTSWNPAGRMRADLIRLLYQKYPERIPHSLLQQCSADKGSSAAAGGGGGVGGTSKEKPSAARTHPTQTHPTLEQNLCPLMNMLDQDFTWDASIPAAAAQPGLFVDASEPVYNTQFALADSIMDFGAEENGQDLMDDAFWAGVNFDFGFEAQS